MKRKHLFLVAFLTTAVLAITGLSAERIWDKVSNLAFAEVKASAADWVVDATACLPKNEGSCVIFLVMADGSRYKVTAQGYSFKKEEDPEPITYTV